MRAIAIFWVIIWRVCLFLVQALSIIAMGRGASLSKLWGESLSSICERLGGAFLKTGQILSTRVDLLPPEIVSPLARLRSDVEPIPFSHLEFHPQSLDNLATDCSPIEIDPIAIAAATIAQVHIGHHQATGQTLAIKIRRPGIVKRLSTDVLYIQRTAKLLARLPWCRQIPVSEATEEVCNALLKQIDFSAESLYLEQFHQLFADDPNIKVPQVDRCRCTSDAIVMEYLEGYRPIHEFRDQPKLVRAAVLRGLHALYKMIFQAGLIHCDLHPSNILCNQYGQVALLDFGFIAEMAPKEKLDFAAFFLSIAVRDGHTAARITRETALRIEPEFDDIAFERDIQSLINRISGLNAADFQVAAFVFELFRIQRRHGIYGSPSFTLPILSLLTYEGSIKDLYPNLDFQREAVPFVLSHYATI